MPGPACHPTVPPARHRSGWSHAAAAGLVVGSALLATAGAGGAEAWTAWRADPAGEPVELAESAGHLLISEVVTGGASASDEFVEIYNPTAGTLPLEGLELIYVSASGATLTRKAEWPAGAPGIPPGAHVLVANEAGTYAATADITYANGLSATGGSVALRIRDAATAIDAVGWGTAASSWLEGTPAPAVVAGHSLERLPGGAGGSGQDTDHNAADYVDRSVPDPQNAASPPIPVDPSPAPTQTPGSTTTATPTAPESTPIPTPIPTPPATPSPTPSVSPIPSPEPMAIAAARVLPDGTVVTIEGVSLSDGAFSDGGGFVADATGGIAVIVSDGTFARGQLLRLTGELDDRFHQRSLRVDAANVLIIGSAQEPDPIEVATGSVAEVVEGQLIVVGATVTSAASDLSGGVAYDIDDGSGPVRLVVLDSTGIDHSGWVRGTNLQLRGVVGQRDSSGTGTSGYRVLPRDAADVLAAAPPSQSPAPSGSATESPSPSDEPGLVTIAAAREAPLNSRLRVRGVVTLPSSVLGDGTAAIQDGSGAIVLRLSDEAGDVGLGDVVVVDGRRSTKSGMETLQVSLPPEWRGSQPQPEPARHSTGSLGEAQEARLVTVRGVVATTPRRSSAQNVYFDLDDGSGPLRVYISPRTGIGPIMVGATLELTGVLGQETSGQQPQRGYRLWPRGDDDVRQIAAGSAPPTDVEGEGGVGTPTTDPVARGLPGALLRPTRAPDLAVPHLIPSRLPHPELTPTPHPVEAAGVRLTSADDTAGVAPWLAVLAAVLAGMATIAAARPGLLERLRLALVKGPSAAADSPSEDVADRAGAAARGLGPLDQAVVQLVPLAVMDDAASADPVPSTGSRSRVRRILPPT